MKLLNYYFIKYGFFGFRNRWRKLNLCSGPVMLPGYCNLDIASGADVSMDLEKNLLPFNDGSMEVVVCISAINYFSRERGKEIINDVYRVLKKGGVARFASQDLRDIANKYINNDKGFFFQKLADGRERFEGETMADKINSWFCGYKTLGGKRCKYFYDYETLALIFKQAGFKMIDYKKFGESRIENIMEIDNRPEQMFFLEAVK
ncbi:class I SAM-dependent methyltransferase [Candidatus Shapirobacteria bacterium]|nr:class I SAM-dependent methyltransferase [Candidatus Shapirobacteria bacterium]